MCMQLTNVSPGYSILLHNLSGGVIHAGNGKEGTVPLSIYQ